VPSAPVWSDYYEPATEQLYTYDSHADDYFATMSYNPYVSYYTYEPITESYIAYTPEVAEWTSYYAAPTEPLYYFDVGTAAYYQETEEPSPYVDYYTYESGSYSPYEPEIVGGQGATAEWYNQQYESPAYSTYVESIDSYLPVEEPSIYYETVSYEPISEESYESYATTTSFYYNPETLTYVEATPDVASEQYYYQTTTYIPIEEETYSTVGGWENDDFWNRDSYTPYYYNEETYSYEEASPEVETESYYYQLTTYEPIIVGGQGATADWYNNQYE
jgi:hypothetical protein